MNCYLSELNTQLSQDQDLSDFQIKQAINELIDDDISVIAKKSFLSELARKGESDEEFASFVKYFRSFSRNPQLEDFSARAIDLCGTGGDRAGSFNVSTFVSIILAAGGVPVIKHGNRSISSKCGSADFLEALGIPMETETDRLQESLKELNFCFLFAPHFHPAFKNLAATRKALAEEGVLTLFNRLGPCLNPALPSHQLLGVYDPTYMRQIAVALQENGGISGWVVHGRIQNVENSGVDELTACGHNLIEEYGALGKGRHSHHPEFWGQSIHPLEDLSGGTTQENISIMNHLLQGEGMPGLRATVLINAASAFFLAGTVKSCEEGIELSEKLLHDGKVSSWIEKAICFFKR